MNGIDLSYSSDLLSLTDSLYSWTSVKCEYIIRLARAPSHVYEARFIGS